MMCLNLHAKRFFTYIDGLSNKIRLLNRTGFSALVVAHVCDRQPIAAGLVSSVSQQDGVHAGLCVEEDFRSYGHLQLR